VGDDRVALGWRIAGIPAMGVLRRPEGLGGTRYTMREKLLAIGEDFWIETEDGRPAFKVDGG
jgi:hypothetical protein